MFNMYDDTGIKTQITNPYQVKKLEPISQIKNKVTKRKEEEQSQSGQPQFSNEVTNTYKQMANIHIEENILHVYQLMHSEFVTLLDTDNLYMCWQTMEKSDLKQIPVVGHNGKIKGLATISNIAKAMVENLEDSHYIKHTSINEIAVHDIVTAEPISDIRRVAQVMVKYHLNTIPITKDDGIVIGMLSRADILKVVASQPHFALLA